MVCNLVVYDLKNTRNMFFATILILLGVLFKTFHTTNPTILQPFLFIGMTLYVVGWAYVGYNLQSSMPDSAQITWAAIAVIVGTSFAYNMTTNQPLQYGSLGLYSAAWLTLGYTITNHLDGSIKYLGLIASVLAIGSAAFLDTSFGISGYTAALAVITLVYGLPTVASIEQDLPDCIDTVLDQIPELKGYETEINCLIKSGCFNKIGTLASLPTRDAKVKLIADVVKCVADKCSSGLFTELSDKFDCYVAEGCLNPIIDNPPTDPGSFLMALAKAVGCIGGNPKCPELTGLPSI